MNTLLHRFMVWMGWRIGKDAEEFIRSAWVEITYRTNQKKPA